MDGNNANNKEKEMTNQKNRQWAVVEDGRLVRTYGREKGSRENARKEAKEINLTWIGAKAVLLTQEQIDALD
jgi:hypothetical protein